MTEEKKEEVEELKKEIVIERLRQAPLTIKVSFGTSNGKFLSRDELIEEVKNNTETGKRIVNVQFAYIRAFKKGMFSDQK